MKKALKILLIFLAVLFLAGSILILIGIMSGGTMNFNIDLKEKKVTTSSEIYKGEETLDPFSDVELDVDAADVSIIKGDGYKISYAIRSDRNPILTNENGKLYFGKQKQQVGIFFGLGNITGKEDLYVKVTVPENVDLNDVKVKSDAGSINLDGINIKNLVADSDAGNVKLSNFELDNLNVDVDSGKAKMSNIKAGTFTIDNNAGKSDIDNMTCDSFKGNFDAGDIDIKNSTIEKVDINIDAGATNISESKVSDVKINSDFGSIKLSLIGEEADYSINSKVDFGSNTINGKKQGTTYTTTGGKKSINVESDSGSISIEFK